MPETEEGVALILLLLVAIAEGLIEVDRKWILDNLPDTGTVGALLLLAAIAEGLVKVDRKWILDTYMDCLAAVHMEGVVTEVGRPWGRWTPPSGAR